MDPTLLIVIIGVLLFVAIFALFSAFLGRSSGLQERVSTSLEKPSAKGFNWRRYMKSSEQVFKPLGEMIPRSPGRRLNHDPCR